MNRQPNESEIATRFFLVHQQFVKGLALYYAPYPDIADDIIQEVYVEFVGKARQWNLSDLKKGKNLLGTMTRHISLRFWEQRRRQLPEVLGEIVGVIQKRSSENENAFDYSREIGLLKKCIDKLSPRGQQMIRLYYFDNIPVKQIAETLSMQSETVYRNLSRLRVKLRAYLKKFLAEGEGNFEEGEIIK